MNEIPQEFIVYAVIGSMIPTFFWLWFWSRRDRFCPEPKTHLLGAFIFGALAALFTLPTQSFVASIFGATSVTAMVLFVSVEEYIKYVCCWYIAMRNNPYYNERIDPIIYLATTALGFAALENILYFLNYLNNFNLDIATIEGGKRIVGATVLHMVTSSIIGIFIAWAFFGGKIRKSIALTFGLLAAIVIHVGFNHMVTFAEGGENMVLIAFAASWFLFMVVLIVIELIRSPVCPPAIDWAEQNF